MITIVWVVSSVPLNNSLYGDRTAVIVSLPKNAQNHNECLTSYDYKCIIRRTTYSSNSTSNCRSAEYEINSYCKGILINSYDSCSLNEIIAVTDGGSFYTSSDNCNVDNILQSLSNGYQVSCNDCAVVIKLENVIQHSQNLF